MRKPKLTFSKWYKWENRAQFPDYHFPGVYMIAFSDKDLEGEKPTYKDVVYIGMSNSLDGLKGRWKQFDNALKGKKGVHSGGERMYKDLSHYPNWQKKLFVCGRRIEIFVVHKMDRSPEELIKMGWVAFLEYEALAECKKITGDEPKYNKK